MEGIKQENNKAIQKDIVELDEHTPVTADMYGYTLLLVEDNESMLTFILERLQENFTVETAMNGVEALEILRSSHIDLIISDIMMPVMDGYQLCKEVKSDMELSHIPIIFLTAKNDIDSKINGLKYGAEAYVEKPFSFNYLKEQVLSLLDNRRREREAFAKRPFFSVNNMQMNKADEEFMNKVIKVIEDNITDDNFGVERMADILCMSRSSLLRKIKTLFNLSPLDFIRLIKLKKAAEFIQEGKYRIGDICYMVGINSPSYFSKLFLKQFGMTPIRQADHYHAGDKECRGRRGHKIDKIPLLAPIGAYLPYFYHFLNRLYIVKEMPILTFVAYLNKRKRFLIRVCFIFLHKNIEPYEKPKATTKKNVGSIPDASSVSFLFQLCQWRQDFLYRCMEYHLR